MRISDLQGILSIAKSEFGDIEVKTQAIYEMGLVDSPYDPADVSVWNFNGKSTLMISFHGYDVLLDNGVDPFDRSKKI